MEIRDLLPIAISIAVLGIAVVYILNINTDLRAEMACTTGHPYNGTRGMCCINTTHCDTSDDIEFTLEGNASVKLMEGLSKIPAKLPLVMGVVVAVVIIGLLVRGLGGISGQA
jgi:hypothetical protein